MNTCSDPTLLETSKHRVTVVVNRDNVQMVRVRFRFGDSRCANSGYRAQDIIVVMGMGAACLRPRLQMDKFRSQYRSLQRIETLTITHNVMLVFCRTAVIA